MSLIRNFLELPTRIETSVSWNNLLFPSQLLDILIRNIVRRHQIYCYVKICDTKWMFDSRISKNIDQSRYKHLLWINRIVWFMDYNRNIQVVILLIIKRFLVSYLIVHCFVDNMCILKGLSELIFTLMPDHMDLNEM